VTRSGRDEKLRAIVVRVIDTRSNTPRIGAIWVANEAMRKLDPAKAIERRQPLIWLGCHLQLRQIARQVLAGKYKDSEEERNRDSLFPDLQWRYPTARSEGLEEPEYILRGLMGEEDVEYNIARLRAEGDAKVRHAAALRAWWLSRPQTAA
jgi:hypothetical protein